MKDKKKDKKMEDEKMTKEKTMKTMVIKIGVVMAVFLGTFALKDFTNFVDKAYGTEVSLRTQARNLVREVKTYKEREKAFDDTIAQKDITHEERADAMNKKHIYIERYAQALLDKINVYIKAAKDAHEEDFSDIEAKLQPTIDALTADISGQDELEARATAEDGVQIVEILDDLKDPKVTCTDDPAATTPAPKKPAVAESDDADKYIEAALWADILENLEPDFTEELSKEDLKELKTQIVESVAGFVESYFAQVQARMENPFMDDHRDDKDQRLFYNPDRQLRKVTKKIKDLKAALEVEGLSYAEINKLKIEKFTAEKLKSYFEKYIQGAHRSSGEAEEGAFAPSSGVDQETMAMLQLLNSQGMISPEEMQMLLMGGGQQSPQAKPKTGFGINLGSTPWGGVDVGFDYNGEDHGMSMGGTFGNQYRGIPGMPGGMMPGMMGPGFNPADPSSDPRMWFGQR